MIDRYEMVGLAAVGAMCPYGRPRTVGSVGCQNCRFNRLEEVLPLSGIITRCEGDAVSVAQHMKQMEIWFPKGNCN